MSGGLAPPTHCPRCGHGPTIHELGCPNHPDNVRLERGGNTMITTDDRKAWTEEALESLTHQPEAQHELQTTETAAWRAGFVAGWIARRAKEAGEAPGRVVPSER